MECRIGRVGVYEQERDEEKNDMLVGINVMASESISERGQNTTPKPASLPQNPTPLTPPPLHHEPETRCT